MTSTLEDTFHDFLKSNWSYDFTFDISVGLNGLWLYKGFKSVSRIGDLINLHFDAEIEPFPYRPVPQSKSASAFFRVRSRVVTARSMGDPPFTWNLRKKTALIPKN